MKLFYKLSLGVFVLLSLGVNAQTLVSTSPANKNVVMEEFTGCSCPACPSGHTTITGITASNPSGRVIVIAMHPTNSSLTPPQPGNPDFRRSFCNAFYTTPYYGSSRSMPSAHINRRIWGAERKLSAGAWATNTTTILSEGSPVNIGMSSTFSQINNALNITVEIYFTANVTDPSTLTLVLTESALIAGQAGSSNPNYIHDHVFREGLTSQWGDLLQGPTTAGTLLTLNYTYDNSVTNYNIDNCHVVAYVGKDYNQSPGDNEVFTGVEIDAKNGSTTGIVETVESLSDMTLFPNPTQDFSVIDFSLVKSSDITLSVFNVLGDLIYEESMGKLGSGQHTYKLPVGKFCMKGGAYFVRLSDGERDVSKKLIVQ